ncbi:hypothetical protein [Streptomyces sp. NP160]|uniref:hypothetical protein n=1 Tax=Streptomyces sp. NP160 TaxID=2586637 RepID=UPI001C590581|nr:hypothetical protein [Streptomyces sp. NP160]
MKVDVLTVRQIEIDRPSDDAGDRLFASSHAWAHDSATPVAVSAVQADGTLVTARTLVATPGPLVAMKLQAATDRGAAKQGTDLQDVVRLVLDPDLSSTLLDQLAGCPDQLAADISLHAEGWFVRNRSTTLRRIHATAGEDVTADDLALTAELVIDACNR